MKTAPFQIVFLILLTVLLAGCPKPILKMDAPEGQETTRPEEGVDKNPRVVAALQLTEQGRRLLADRQPDKAIRALEQAVSLDPANGQNYYYLAEAWLLKESVSQAKEFNHLAEIHLKENSAWMIRVAQQADRIAELEK